MRSLEEQLGASQGEATIRLIALRDVLGRVKPLVEPPHQTRDQETETIKVPLVTAVGYADDYLKSKCLIEYLLDSGEWS